MDEGVSLLELAKDAHRLFEKQSAGEKSRLLNFVLSNCSWKHGNQTVNFKQLFDLLAETTAIAAQEKTAGMRDSDRFEKWLPGPDSNQRPSD